MEKNNVIEEKKQLKVLIVDDELDICYLLSGVMRQRNFRAGFVTSLSDASIALRSDTPSLLFLDNRLPDGYGLDFIPYVKRNYPETKIVMITAHDSLHDKTRAFAGGADLFISKPLNRDLVNKAIDQLV
ncbi:MAG TPA: response regulator [Puia sp.]|nr:response regulator [Puia sp.]